MSTWTWVAILTLGLVKLPIAALMLWLPFRSDAAMTSRGESAPADSSEEDGGSKTLPGGSGGPRSPHPRAPLRGPRPRRGPHDSAAPPSPARVRRPRRRRVRV